MRFYRTLLNYETGLWPLQIESNQTLFYVPWTVKDRTHGPALTHWGRVTHICVSKLTTIGSDNGLSPGRRQAIIWSNAGILFNWTLGTNFSEILSEIDTFSFKQMRLKMSSGKWRPYWISINISLKFVPRGPINNIPTLLQVMAWRRPSNKPLSEPMMVRLTTHIYASLGLNELSSGFAIVATGWR